MTCKHPVNTFTDRQREKMEDLVTKVTHAPGVALHGWNGVTLLLQLARKLYRKVGDSGNHG